MFLLSRTMLDSGPGSASQTPMQLEGRPHKLIVPSSRSEDQARFIKPVCLYKHSGQSSHPWDSPHVLNELVGDSNPTTVMNDVEVDVISACVR